MEQALIDRLETALCEFTIAGGRADTVHASPDLQEAAAQILRTDLVQASLETPPSAWVVNLKIDAGLEPGQFRLTGPRRGSRGLPPGYRMAGPVWPRE